jgi:uncharacterized membrane protein YphA (DoxX/SURF4 family)
MTLARSIPTAARLLLGSIFFVFGLNGFLGFLPQPPVTPEGGAFLGALAATGYMFPLIKGTEVLAGALLLSGQFVPLALVLLSPIVVNIFAFHALLSPGLALPSVIATLLAYLAYTRREAYAALFDRPVAARPIAVREPQRAEVWREAA